MPSSEFFNRTSVVTAARLLLVLLVLLLTMDGCHRLTLQHSLVALFISYIRNHYG